MKNVIVITGASSGFSALAARALAVPVTVSTRACAKQPQCATGQGSGEGRNSELIGMPENQQGLSQPL